MFVIRLVGRIAWSAPIIAMVRGVVVWSTSDFHWPVISHSVQSLVGLRIIAVSTMVILARPPSHSVWVDISIEEWAYHGKSTY